MPMYCVNVRVQGGSLYARHKRASSRKGRERVNESFTAFTHHYDSEAVQVVHFTDYLCKVREEASSTVLPLKS